MSDRYPFFNWSTTSQPTFVPFGSTSAMTGTSLPSFTTPLFNVPENHPASAFQNATPGSSSTPSNPFAQFQTPSTPVAFGPSSGFAFTAVQLQSSAFSRTPFPDPATSNSGDFVFPRHPRSYRTRPPVSNAEMNDDVMEPMNRDAPLFQNQVAGNKQRTEMEFNYMKDVFPKDVQSTFQSSHLRRTPSTTWTGPPQTTPAPDLMQDTDMEMDGIVESGPVAAMELPPVHESNLPFPVFGSGWSQSSSRLSGSPQPFQSSFFGSGGLNFSSSSPFGASPGRSSTENFTPVNFSETSFPSPFGRNQSSPSFTLNSFPFVFRASSGQQSAFGESSGPALMSNQGLNSSSGVLQFGASSVVQGPFGTPGLSAFQTPRTRSFDSPLFAQSSASSTSSQGFFGSGSSLETSYAQGLLDHQLQAATGSAPVTGFFASPNTSYSKTHFNLLFGQQHQTPEQTILKTNIPGASPEQRTLNTQSRGSSPDQTNLTMQDPSNLRSQDLGFRPVQPNLGSQDLGFRPAQSNLGSQDQGFRPVQSNLGSQDQGFRPVQSNLGSQDQGFRPVQSNLGIQDQGFRPVQSNLGMQDQGFRPVQSNLGMQDQGFRPDQMNPRTQGQSFSPGASWPGLTPVQGLFQFERNTPERIGTVPIVLTASSPDSDAMTPEERSPPLATSRFPELIPVQSSESPMTIPASLPARITIPEEKGHEEVPLSETTEITEGTLEPISEEVDESETDTEMNDASPIKHLPDSTPDSTELATETEDLTKESQEPVEDASTNEDGVQTESLEADKSIIEDPVTSDPEPALNQEDKSIVPEVNTEDKSLDQEAANEDKSVDQEISKEDTSVDPELTEEESKSLKRAAKEAAILTNAEIIEEWTQKINGQTKRNREIAEEKVLEEIRQEELHRAKRIAFEIRLTPAEKEYVEYERQLRRIEVRYEQLSKERTFRSVDGLTEEQVEELLPTVESDDYYFSPNAHILKDMVCGKGVGALKQMYGFVIGRKGHGKVEFDLPIDITKMEIDKVVEIRAGNLEFLQGIEQFEKIPMTVTLYKVHLEGFRNVYEKTRRRVRKYCKDNGHEFVSYDRDGTWVFRIEGSK